MTSIRLSLAFLVFFLVVPKTMISATDNPGYSLDGPDPRYGTFVNVHSESMNRDIPTLVFVPKNTVPADRRLPVVYMLHGTNSLPINEESLRTMHHPGTRVQELAEDFGVIIVAPLTGISYFLDSPLKKDHLYGTFVGVELPGFIDKNFPTIADRKGRFLAGFSMGGYGAASLLCRYPDTFSVALCRAGVMNLTTAVDDLAWDGIAEQLVTLLGDNFSDPKVYHLNGCFNLANHVRFRKDVSFVIQVGKDDFLFKTNKAFHEWLDELGIANIYGVYPGGHAWSDNALRSLLSDLQYFAPTQFPPK